jgi:hypothetical protein
MDQDILISLAHVLASKRDSLSPTLLAALEEEPFWVALAAATPDSLTPLQREALREAGMILDEEI